MKKEILDILKLNIKNSFSEDGQKAADAIIAALDALKADEANEFGPDDIKEAAAKAVDEIFAKEEEMPEAVAEMCRKVVANAIEARMKTANKVADGIKELPVAVRNEVAKAIMNCTKKDQIKDAVMAVMTKNGISGLEFARVIDYSIVNNFEDGDEIYNALNVTPIDEWFYTAQDLLDEGISAKAWIDQSEGTKRAQEITVESVKISPDYVYKKQEFKNALLTKLRKDGKEAQFLAWITKELRQMNHATQVQAILVGDQSNSGTEKLGMFQTITRQVSDNFVTVSTAAADLASVEEARAASDEVHGHGKEVWAVMTQKQLTALAAFRYADGGTPHYRSKDEVAAELGVARVVVVEPGILAGKALIVFFTPQEYFVNRDETIEVAYPSWDDNKQKYLYEEYTGGAIHGLKSAAVILPQAEPSTSGSRSKSGSASV